MRKKSYLFFVISIVAGLAFALAAVAYAQTLAKPYAEGFGAGATGRSAQGDAPDEKPYAEGEGYDRAGARQESSEQKSETPEGSAGKSGVGGMEVLSFPGTSAAGDLSILYLFSGVTDDGEQGSASRREATSIHCTNIGVDNTQVEVQVYQWNGTDVYTGTVNMPPNRTFTFSTQNTTIYFDDVILGGSPGTVAIFQGSGRVLADSDHVICTAQTLDPLNYPPEFVTTLELFRQ